MSQVSKRTIKPEIAKRIDELFIESISSCDEKNSLAEFLDDLLTSTEKVMLSKRLCIAYLLSKGYTYEVINNVLKVSNPTIRTVSLIMRYKGKGISNSLNKLVKKERWLNFFKDLADIAIELMGSGKGGNWKTTKSYLFHRKLEKKSPL